MCEIYSTRKSKTKVYIDLGDEKNSYFGVKSIPIEKFEFAKKFRNMDFLAAVSESTNGRSDRGLKDSFTAVPFIDDYITYTV